MDVSVAAAIVIALEDERPRKDRGISSTGCCRLRLFWTGCGNRHILFSTMPARSGTPATARLKISVHWISLKPLRYLGLFVVLSS